MFKRKKHFKIYCDSVDEYQAMTAYLLKLRAARMCRSNTISAAEHAVSTLRKNYVRDIQLLRNQYKPLIDQELDVIAELTNDK